MGCTIGTTPVVRHQIEHSISTQKRVVSTVRNKSTVVEIKNEVIKTVAFENTQNESKWSSLPPSMTLRVTNLKPHVTNNSTTVAPAASSTTELNQSNLPNLITKDYKDLDHPNLIPVRFSQNSPNTTNNIVDTPVKPDLERSNPSAFKINIVESAPSTYSTARSDADVHEFTKFGTASASPIAAHPNLEHSDALQHSRSLQTARSTTTKSAIDKSKFSFDSSHHDSNQNTTQAEPSINTANTANTIIPSATNEIHSGTARVADTTPIASSETQTKDTKESVTNMTPHLSTTALPQTALQHDTAGISASDASDDYQHMRRVYKIMSKSTSKNDTDLLFATFIQNHPTFKHSSQINNTLTADSPSTSPAESRKPSIVNSEVAQQLEMKLLHNDSERELLWNSCFKTIQEGIAIIDHRGTILYANPALQNILQDTTLIHKNISYFIPKTVFNFTYRPIPRSRQKQTQNGDRRDSPESSNKSSKISHNSTTTPSSASAPESPIQNIAATVNVVTNNPKKLRTIYSVDNMHIDKVNMDKVDKFRSDTVIPADLHIATELNVVEEDDSKQYKMSMIIELFTNAQQLITVRMSCGPILLTVKDRCYSFIVGFQDVTRRYSNKDTTFRLLGPGGELPSDIETRLQNGENNICTVHPNAIVSCLSFSHLDNVSSVTENPTKNSDAANLLQQLSRFFDELEHLLFKYKIIRLDNIGTSYLFVSNLWHSNVIKQSESTTELNELNQFIKNHVSFLLETLFLAKSTVSRNVKCGLTIGSVSSLISGLYKPRFQIVGAPVQTAIDLQRIDNAICCNIAAIVQHIDSSLIRIDYNNNNNNNNNLHNRDENGIHDAVHPTAYFVIAQ